jgi:hypothetical protein
MEVPVAAASASRSRTLSLWPISSGRHQSTVPLGAPRYIITRGREAGGGIPHRHLRLPPRANPANGTGYLLVGDGETRPRVENIEDWPVSRMRIEILPGELTKGKVSTSRAVERILSYCTCQREGHKRTRRRGDRGCTLYESECGRDGGDCTLGAGSRHCIRTRL